MLASSWLLPYAWTKLFFSELKPHRHTSSWIVAARARQRSTGPGSPNAVAVLIARSNPTQHITLE
jgi:hypothetical protein